MPLMMIGLHSRLKTSDLSPVRYVLAPILHKQRYKLLYQVSFSVPQAGILRTILQADSTTIFLPNAEQKLLFLLLPLIAGTMQAFPLLKSFLTRKIFRKIKCLLI